MRNVTRAKMPKPWCRHLANNIKYWTFMLLRVCAWITVIIFTKIYWILPVHSNVTIKNVSGLTLAGPLCTFPVRCCNLTLSPLSSHSVGSPDLELPDTTLFVTVFPKFPSQYFIFVGINQRPAGRYFSLTGICNGMQSRFSGITGWDG